MVCFCHFLGMIPRFLGILFSCICRHAHVPFFIGFYTTRAPKIGQFLRFFTMSAVGFLSKFSVFADSKRKKYRVSVISDFWESMKKPIFWSETASRKSWQRGEPVQKSVIRLQNDSPPLFSEIARTQFDGKCYYCGLGLFCRLVASGPLLPTAVQKVLSDRMASWPLLPTAAPKIKFCNSPKHEGLEAPHSHPGTPPRSTRIRAPSLPPSDPSPKHED